MCLETVQEVSANTVSECKSDIEKKNPVSDQTNNDFDNNGKM
jgi:hypothetical protein